VCPAAWGGTYALVLAAAVPDGSIMVAASSGIQVLADDGTFAAHPDALASGQVIAFAATPKALYVLHRRNDATEVIAFGAGKPHLVWTDPNPWNDLAASDTELLVLRVDDVSIEQLRLSTRGDVISDERAPAPDSTAAVFARLAGNTAYAVAAAAGGLELDLGRIEDDRFKLLQTARGNLAGPLDTADGHRFVATEGALARFDDEHLEPLGVDAIVTYLGRDGDNSYACTRSEIRALDARGLGETRFDIRRLAEPDLSIVPEPLRSECSAQWDHFRFDLLASGVTLASERDSDAGTDAGADAAVASGGRTDAGNARPQPKPRAPHPSSGCTVRRTTIRACDGHDGPFVACGWLAILAAQRARARHSSGARSRRR
jgi:hypothetical protein